MPAPAAPATPIPAAADMITAIHAVGLTQAQKIGAMCVALTKANTPLPIAELGIETGILAGLDLAAEKLAAAL